MLAEALMEDEGILQRHKPLESLNQADASVFGRREKGSFCIRGRRFLHGSKFISGFG